MVFYEVPENQSLSILNKKIKIKIMEKNCPRCGGIVSCSHTNKSACKCASSKLDEQQFAYVRMNYSTCLCSSCQEEVKNYFYAFGVNPRYKQSQL